MSVSLIETEAVPLPKTGLLAVVLFVTILAATLRLPALDLRPMHGDEANQAVKAGALLERGYYRYDPHDHHGPTLYYLALIPAWLRGVTEYETLGPSSYRIVPVVFGIATVALSSLLASAFGLGAALLVGTLTALSPAFVFYSRYFIQESLLVFFTLLAVYAAWRYTRKASLPWALCCGASLSLMHATKETAIIAYAAMIGAFLFVRYLQGRNGAARADRINPRHIILASVLAVVLSITLFSSLFSYWRGPLDSILTYGNYLHRAGGVGLHDKPWYYYLQTLAYVHRGPGPRWSEGSILLLGVMGLALAVGARNAIGRHINLFRFLAVYTVLVSITYSIIPYKTPWTILTPLHGFILVGGIGAARLIQHTPSKGLKIVAWALLIAASLHLGRQAHLANTKYYADPRNPYVYAHTSTAFLRLPERINALASVHPEGKALSIRVIQPDKDYWPIPWYLREFTRIGFWLEIPQSPDADVIIADPGITEALGKRLKKKYVTETVGLRPAILRTLYIEQGLWDSLIASRR